MNWLATNWHALLSVATALSGVTVFVVHNIGHVTHDTVADQVNATLKGLNGTP